MNLSICPICDLPVPFLDIQWHVNRHFEDEELARDMELAQQLEFAPQSPPVLSNNQEKNDIPCETSVLKSHGSSISRHKGRRSDGREGNIDENISDLIGVQIRAPFYKVEAGLMALLKKCLELDSENSTSILSGYVDHFQSTETEDVGWGCGWRNIQMLSSHLLVERQDAREALFGGSGYVPDIASLQRWLEIAWEMGFDELGASHFNQKIYGKKNWIGTTECATLFRSFGLRAKIVDFDSKNVQGVSSSHDPCEGVSCMKIYGPMDRYLSRGNLNIHQESSSGPKCSYSSICSEDDAGTFIWSKADTRSLKGHQVLIHWVWNYFSDSRLTKLGNARVIVSDKMPLYFQHDGHSRTIIGIQVKQQHKGVLQYNLLILDPAHKTAALERSLQENVGWQSLIKRGVHTLKKPQYQLCYIDPGIADEEEMEQLKTLDSFYIQF